MSSELELKVLLVGAPKSVSSSYCSACTSPLQQQRQQGQQSPRSCCFLQPLLSISRADDPLYSA